MFPSILYACLSCCRMFDGDFVSLGNKLPVWTNRCYISLSDSSIQRKKCYRCWKPDHKKEVMIFIMTYINNCCQMLRGCDVAAVCWVSLVFVTLFHHHSLSLFSCCHILPCTFIFSSYCVLFLQEGQVLECSLINSIRVGAVPKVRPPERQFSHFLFL